MRTIDQIAEDLRLLYPTATSVRLFVIPNGFEVEEKHDYYVAGESSWRTLNGSRSPAKYLMVDSQDAPVTEPAP